jgi:hypothetical protein
MNPEPAKISDAPPQMLLANLLYESVPVIDPDLFRSRLKSALPESNLLAVEPASHVFLISHDAHPMQLADGAIPAQTAIFLGKQGPPPQLDSALQQTYGWRDAAKIVPRCRYHLGVAEMMARLLPPDVRYRLWNAVLLVLMDLIPPAAVHVHHCERIVAPEEVRRSSGTDNAIDRLCTLLNVRMFRITDSQPGDMLMDTRGLAALGLPDLQLHFRGLTPGKVAGELFNLGAYIFANGDCIKDGHTVQGFGANEKWRCQHEMSLLGPKRVVIDIDPGDPYAAGKRKRSVM